MAQKKNTSDLEAALELLKRRGTKKTRDGYARYGIVAPKAFGVTVGDIQRIAKTVGSNHDLAEALWKSGWYEARMLAAFVAEPDRVTAAQMDRWCRDFDNWGICDTVCFKLFDRSPLAFNKVRQWARLKDEFGRRGSFALLASLALHDKQSDNEAFVRCLPLIEHAASDDRNFVKKAVSWALRAIGGRNAELHAAAITVAKRLAESEEPTPRWIGKDALRDLTRPLIVRELASAAGK